MTAVLPLILCLATTGTLRTFKVEHMSLLTVHRWQLLRLAFRASFHLTILSGYIRSTIYYAQNSANFLNPCLATFMPLQIGLAVPSLSYMSSLLGPTQLLLIS